MKRSVLLLALAVLIPAGEARADFALSGSPIVFGGDPRDLKTADFNGDGRPDLATARRGDGKVTVLLRTAGGGFAPETFDSAAGANDLAVADYNADGRPDLAVANVVAGNFRVFLRGASGGFTFEGTEPAVNNAFSIVAGRFNGDDRPDLVVGSSFTDAVYPFTHNPAATGFSADGPEITTGGHKTDVAAGDFDDDGRLDIATANDTAGQIGVMLRNPVSGFTPLPAVTTGARPQRLIAADFNADALPDLAVSNTDGDSVSLLINQGGATFAQAAGSPYAVGDAPLGLAAADFDKDGKLDLAVANNLGSSLSLFRGTGARLNPAPQPVLPLDAEGANGLVAVDLDADGWTDLAVANPVSGSVSLVRNVPPPVTPPPPPPPPADPDGDGDGSPRSADCDDANAGIRPGAVDVPGDGVDQDCANGDAAFPRIKRTVAYKLGFGNAFTIFSKLRVKPARAGDTVRFACKGDGCKRTKSKVAVKKDGGGVSLSKFVKGARLKPGTKVEIRVTRPAAIGHFRRFTVRSGKPPKQTRRCLVPGSPKPVKCA
ncbi:MAG TPA: FG-GAP-like repeat-containing protein [Solirubrobacteraceae bacterium]|nr:FG-GAP-like repeat-containing protein [Solirubrobacteraceae bacterium]